MFDSVLIANRGEIACRIVRTCRRLGIRTIAVASDVDLREPHALAADQVVRIGPAEATASYLDVAAILSAAADTGAQAIHPGYGFLAESPVFAEAVRDAGLAFVGPSPEVIRLMGDKAAAKRHLAAAGVPLIPGTQDDALDDAELIAAAEQLGAPLLVKAVAGGGGKGMRTVLDLADLPAALAAAKREAAAGFGDDRVMLERLVARPRHIEVQVMADQHGTVLHLLERECSIQRRHQKVVEECPSPAVDDALRQRLGDAAVTAARSVDYEGAGTIEFLLDADTLDDDEPTFAFLEMNTRLQVEHPVTELVTGLDLVEMQLRVAAGERLELEQSAIEAAGHAIEVRLYAEDPVSQLPQTGSVERLAWPDHAWARVDSGVTEGSEVTPYYDPMLAKLIVHGEDREAACDRIADAVATTTLHGVITNLEMLAAIVEHPVFRSGALTTGFLPEHLGSWQPKAVDDHVLADAALALTDPSGLGLREAGSAFAALGAFRLGGAGGTPVLLADGDETHVLSVRTDGGGRPATVSLDGAAVEPDGADTLTTVTDDGRSVWVHRPGVTRRLTVVPSTRHADLAAVAGTAAFTAPMPGSVLEVSVEAGEQVTAGTTMVVVEAMKMEHPVTAPADGTVTEVHVRTGDRVDAGTALLSFTVDT